MPIKKGKGGAGDYGDSWTWTEYILHYEVDMARGGLFWFKEICLSVK
jgi:hypothetical protein